MFYKYIANFYFLKGFPKIHRIEESVCEVICDIKKSAMLRKEKAFFINNIEILKELSVKIISPNGVNLMPLITYQLRNCRCVFFPTEIGLFNMYSFASLILKQFFF